MPVTIASANAAVVATVDAAVRRDPVQNTILATIANDLRRTGTDGWCAEDGAAVAARSTAAKPVALSGGWSDVPGLAAALAGLDDLTSVGGPTATVDALLAPLGRAVVDGRDERLFRCDAVDEPRGVPGRARPAIGADAELLDAWRPPYLIDVFGRLPPGFHSGTWAADLLRGSRVWLWEVGGVPVAQAAVQGAVAGVARIGPVYTPPEHRGHGYASAVTAVAAADTLAAGHVPVLFTDLANPTSNKIYQRIGFRAVADRRAVWFA